MTDMRHPGHELSAYLDGELGPARRAEIETHLSECPACAGAVADLRGLRGAVSALEDREPAADLWPGIRDRIAVREGVRVVPITRRPRHISLSWTQLAAASVALLILGAASVWLAVSGRTPGGAPVVAEREAAAGGTVSLAGDFGEAPYEAAVAELQAALDASRDELDPQTVRTIEQNLVIIDRAIEDTRRALAADPSSVYLSAHLAEQRQRKLDVLRTATTVATTSI